MRDTDQRTAAKKFAADWKDQGYEKGQSQPFWLELLGNVYGVENPAHFITFEDQVHLDNTSFIDGNIPATHVLIEQKGLGKDLKKPIKQSDGSLCTPFQQAKRYAAELPYSMRPRWIVTCNFAEFNVYDMEHPSGEPEVIYLKDLEKEYYRLQFLTDTGDENIKKEMEVSIQAGNLVGVLYDELLKQYRDPKSPESLKSLNMLCVRLVFCLYAEDAGIFGGHARFHNYLGSFPAKALRGAIIELFRVLDTPVEERDPYLEDQLAAFPYVNGGLFEKEDIEIPQMNDAIRDLLLHNASADFDWSGISPTIFGAVFESTLNPETRRSGGMHYTSIENIHKVIDPLFLDSLRAELADIKEIRVAKTQENKLKVFREKLSKLIFLDPACGSGNFLTETYIALRRLENEAILMLTRGQMVMDVYDPIKVSIGQFYGIEINDFAVTVAKTALWIAESQMMKETEDIIHRNLDFLPLKSYANIVEGNALRLDWESVVPKASLSYIMGNPPFVGYSHQSTEQKADLRALDSEIGKNIDYVAGWYFKTAQTIKNTNIRAAFVSTNSITQGEQVAAVWKPLITKYGVHIDFAYRTFKWGSEARDNAAVHCVIIGFSCSAVSGTKHIFNGTNTATEVENISPYLIDAPTVFIESRTKPICDVPGMHRGSQPTDDGNFILREEEAKQLIIDEPEVAKFIRPYMMGKDFIARKPRYCIWLDGANPADVKKCRLIMQRIQNVKAFRESSKKAATRKKAETPMLFDENQQPDTAFVALPKVSSENRRYVPMDFMTPETVAGDKIYIVENATLYHFGILTSNIHMAWMRAVCGRMKSDYSYSNTIVYNNFPWPSPTDAQKAKIEQTAQAILDARALYPDSSLADLYDELTMPPELRRAHQQNDRAVMRAYGFDIKTTTESSCVAELMKMYQKLTDDR